MLSELEARMTGRWRGVRLIVAGAVLLAETSCSTTGLLFRHDHRLEIVSPKAGARVSVPVVVSWRATDMPRGSHFAVFLDRAPQRPGKTLAWLDRKLPVELRGRSAGIYETSRTSLTIREVTRRLNAPSTDRDRHEVTVVVVDDKTRRLGEVAAYADFRVEGTS
jgi:hypothetical protein